MVFRIRMQWRVVTRSHAHRWTQSAEMSLVSVCLLLLPLVSIVLCSPIRIRMWWPVRLLQLLLPTGAVLLHLLSLVQMPPKSGKGSTVSPRLRRGGAKYPLPSKTPPTSVSRRDSRPGTEKSHGLIYLLEGHRVCIKTVAV